MTSIHILLDCQELRLVRRNSVLFTCPISSGKNGVGFGAGSGQTPLGSFRICAKIGEGRPLNTIFRSRRPEGFYPEAIPLDMGPDADFILTRILWLDGMDENNANTKERYIYLHGTNRTDLLGTPASHGCIRLSPEDMKHVFDLVDELTPVLITC